MTKIIVLREKFRELKSTIVHRYLDLRINNNNNPYRVLFRKNPYRILFILGHMRAASSLLSHILTSNSEIIGYGETHTQYYREQDLKKLILKVYRNYYQLKNMTMSHKYILDKVLHNNKFIDDSFLKHDQVYSVFLVRKPQRTIASILDLKPDWDENKALKYYTERLAKLEEHARFINNKNHSLFIQQEKILEDTENVFQALQNFLDTKTGFSEKYNVQKTTGMRYVGDQTANIKSGRIVRQKRTLDIEVKEATVEKAMESYQKCCQTLSDYCTLV
ncbi:MAG: sulfotransferase family protein [Xenococcaceae cyanobacterium]